MMEAVETSNQWYQNSNFMDIDGGSNTDPI